jgi:hypothetical protein
MNVEKLILSFQDQQAINDACHSEHRNRYYIASVWVKVAHEMG